MSIDREPNINFYRSLLGGYSRESLEPELSIIKTPKEIFLNVLASKILKGLPTNKIENFINLSDPTLKFIRLLDSFSAEGSIDRFVREILRPDTTRGPRPKTSWHPWTESFPHTDHVRTPDRSAVLPPVTRRESFHSSTGLRASIRSYSPRLTVNGSEVTSNNEFTRVDFTPGSRASRDPRKITESLVAGINGIAELLDAVDNGKMDLAPIFVGHTNIHMAQIAQRLGFTIVDECKTEDGKIKKDLSELTVVGKLDDIRRKVSEFRQAQTYERLQERAQKLPTYRPRPQFVPA